MNGGIICLAFGSEIQMTFSTSIAVLHNYMQKKNLLAN